MADTDEVLTTTLQEAQQRGYLGRAPIAAQIAHARAYLAAAPPGLVSAVDRAVDLGAGGGIPGLILSVELVAQWVLVERSGARADWLQRAVRRLGIAGRVTVLAEAAQDVGRSAWRGQCQLVVARCFAAPALVAECAAPLLEVGGYAIVSDLTPTFNRSHAVRWPAAGLGALGMVAHPSVRQPEGSFIVLEQCVVVGPDVPRPPGASRRRPWIC